MLAPPRALASLMLVIASATVADAQLTSIFARPVVQRQKTNLVRAAIDRSWEKQSRVLDWVQWRDAAQNLQAVVSKPNVSLIEETLRRYQPDQAKKRDPFRLATHNESTGRNQSIYRLTGSVRLPAGKHRVLVVMRDYHEDLIIAAQLSNGPVLRENVTANGDEIIRQTSAGSSSSENSFVWSVDVLSRKSQTMTIQINKPLWKLVSRHGGGTGDLDIVVEEEVDTSTSDSMGETESEDYYTDYSNSRGGAIQNQESEASFMSAVVEDSPPTVNRTPPPYIPTTNYFGGGGGGRNPFFVDDPLTPVNVPEFIATLPTIAISIGVWQRRKRRSRRSTTPARRKS